MSKRKFTFNEKIDNFLEKFQLLFPVGLMAYALLVMFFIAFLGYLTIPETFYNKLIFYCYEIFIVLFGMLYVLYSYDIILHFIYFIIMILINFFILILNCSCFKKEKKYFSFNKNNKVFIKSKFYLSNLLLISLFGVLIGIVYLNLIEFRMLNNFIPIEKYFLLAYYIGLLTLSSFILSFYEFYLTRKKLKINIFNPNKGILFIFIFIVIFGFSLIQIDKLNNEDLIEVPYLNCTYYSASYEVVVQNHSVNCKFSAFNESSNYSIIFSNVFSGDKFRYNLTSNNISMKIQFPNKKESYYYKILEDGLILYQDNIHIVSHEKYLDTLEKIEDRKLTYFIGSFIVFFALIQFLISLDNWLNKPNQT